jgi:hypothetical protein
MSWRDTSAWITIGVAERPVEIGMVGGKPCRREPKEDWSWRIFPWRV